MEEEERQAAQRRRALERERGRESQRGPQAAVHIAQPTQSASVCGRVVLSVTQAAAAKEERQVTSRKYHFHTSFSGIEKKQNQTKKTFCFVISGEIFIFLPPVQFVSVFSFR